MAPNAVMGTRDALFDEDVNEQKRIGIPVYNVHEQEIMSCGQSGIESTIESDSHADTWCLVVPTLSCPIIQDRSVMYRVSTIM